MVCVKVVFDCESIDEAKAILDNNKNLNIDHKCDKSKSCFYCTECNAVIDQNIRNYSESHFGRSLCFKCQKKVK